MNSQFKLKFLHFLHKKSKENGFTLIELLVVVMIIGVLAAIALPNLLGQIAKGRQAEAKNALGTINRAQQAYRLDSATFTAITNLPVNLNLQYYTIGSAQTAGVNGAGAIANATTNYANDILDYTAGVGQTTGGVFSAVLCEQTTNVSANLSPTTDITIGTASAVADCAGNTKQIK
ncbi:MAG: hypothetical protein N5P05_002997 [Chroococcopsis gigantea SAG 12.99]|jgi:type IV pilus assembly protein PilA|nr:prepilin-type N-terminal cleavage/methylation domain-containing protein [Chlorogloea purpurea SAG 13.99]MDV3001391.1 hypothetical protein [Chroococcopsis gigantea SAG 12.99]